MFQDGFLIIKSDFIHHRKDVLIFLLQQGFQIQGSRRVLFSPELAAEFYYDLAEDPCFMLQVILLSKGVSEAFILTKENAVEDLLKAMVCYFGSSTEMDRNVYVTRCLAKVKKDITFVFPNYIPEPITCPTTVCRNNPFVTSLMHQVYDIVTKPEIDPHKSWRIKLSEWCLESNKNLPSISNQCAHNPSLNVREIAIQTKKTAFKNPDISPKANAPFLSSGSTTDDTSANLTSSSCVSCSDFASSDACITQQGQAKTMDDIVKAKTAPLKINDSCSSSDICKEICNDIGEVISAKQSEAKVSANVPQNSPVGCKYCPS